MQRVSDPTKEADKFGSGKHGHTEGVEYGESPTIVRAVWLDAVQEELANAIEGDGQTLDPDDDTQLATALSGMCIQACYAMPINTTTSALTKIGLSATLATGEAAQDAGFSLSSDEVVVARAGVYEVSFILNLSGTTASAKVKIFTTSSDYTFETEPGGGVLKQLVGKVIVDLAADDHVYLYNATAGSSLTTHNTTGLINRLYIRRLHT